MSRQRDAVRDVLDMFLTPPPGNNESRAAVEYQAASRRALDFLWVKWFQDPDGRPISELSMRQRSLVQQGVRDISSMSKRARAAGMFVPEDPAPRINEMNKGRKAGDQLSESQAVNDLHDSLVLLSELVRDERDGKVALERLPSPQPESVAIGFSGIGGLPSEVVDADIMKRQQVFDRLAQVNFSKRRPRVLFVAERPRDGRVDVVLGWRRMRDAGGYVVSVRDVFGGILQEFDAGDPTVDTTPDEDVLFFRERVAPVFPSLEEPDVVLFSFTNLRPHALFSFKVTAYQTVATGKNDLFRMQLNRASLEKESLGTVAEAIAAFGVQDVDNVTPYPFISELVYGDRSYGWILAGLNVLASYDRGESSAEVRSYSYLGARWTDIRSKIESGRFFLPVDRDDAVARFDASIRNFGLQKTLAEVLEKTGLLFFFDERENFDVDSTLFDRESALLETSLLSVMIESIDASSLMIDPTVVYANVTRMVRQSAGGKLSRTSGSEVPRLDTDDSFVDLLTFEGMTRFVNIIVDASRRSS